MLGRSLAVALVLGAAVAVGGCASGRVREANDYVNAVNSAQSSFAAASHTLLDQMSPGSTSAAERAKLRRFYAAVDGFVARLQAIKPPARVRALHGRLIATMQDFGQNLHAAGAAILSRNALKVLDGQQRLASATSRVARNLDHTVGQINTALHN